MNNLNLVKMKKVVIFIFVSLIVLGCSSSEKKLQKEWVMSNAPQIVWREYAESKLQEKLLELTSTLNSTSASKMMELKAQRSKTGKEDRAKRNAIHDYKEHTNHIVSNLKDNFKECSALIDSTSQEMVNPMSNDELVNVLLGTPGELPQISDEEQFSMVRDIVAGVLQELSYPEIQTCEYDKENEFWKIEGHHDFKFSQYIKFVPVGDSIYNVTGGNYVAGSKPVEKYSMTVALK